MVPVRYIGCREHYRDGTYGSGIMFEKGETVLLPSELAMKLLRHPDVYAHGDGRHSQATPRMSLGKAFSKSDNDGRELYDNIACMDKNALEAFAQLHFNVRLNRRQRIESLRQQVLGLADRFGLE